MLADGRCWCCGRGVQVMLGLMSVWNVSFLGYPARAILPYTQVRRPIAQLSHLFRCPMRVAMLGQTVTS